MHAGEATQHEAAHGGVDERLVRNGQTLIVADQATAVQQPREGPFHYPPPRQDALEAHLAFDGDPFEAEAGDRVHDTAEAALPGARMLHDVHAPAQVLLDPLPPAAGVALVQPHVLEARELLGDPVQQQRDGGTFLDGCRMDDGPEHQAERVDQDVALAAIDLLATVEAAHATYARGLDALAVDDAGARLRLPPGHDPHVLAQGHVELLPGTVPAEAPKPPVDRLPRRVLVRQGTPLAAGADDIEDAVQQFSQGVLPRPAAPRRRQMGHEAGVLSIGQVTRVGAPHASTAPQSPFPVNSN